MRGVTDDSGALVGTADYTVFGGVHTQSGQSSAFGFTGELFTPQTNLLHLRARDLNPSLGRFLSADSVQPNAPGTQGFNLYAYVANNPTTWVDHSGHSASETSVAHDTPMSHGQAAVVAGLIASLPALVVAGTLGGLALGIASVFLLMACVLYDDCLAMVGDAAATIGEYGSTAGGAAAWGADQLSQAVASHPLLPGASTPTLLLFGLGLSFTGLDTAYDAIALASGHDPFTGEALSPAQLGMFSLALALPSISGHDLSLADEALKFVDNDGEVLHFYHGTNSTAAESILNDGIDLARGRFNLDFNPAGKIGFYVTKDYNQAATWAQRIAGRNGGTPVVLKFAIPSGELGSLNGKAFLNSTDEWAQFVAAGRRGELQHVYDYVEGPMLANPGAVKTGGILISVGHQLAIFTEDAAKLFQRYLLP